MSSSSAFNDDKGGSSSVGEPEYGHDPASGGIFSSDYKRYRAITWILLWAVFLWGNNGGRLWRGMGQFMSNTPTGVCLSRLACDWKRRRMTFFGRECPWNRDLSRWCQTEGPVLALTSNRAFPGWSVTSAAVCIGTVLNVMLLCWDVRGLRSTGLSCCFSAPRCWTAHTAEAAAQHTQHFALYTYYITPCIYQWHTTCNKAFVKAVVHYTTLCITDFLARWRPVYKHENTLYMM